MRNIFTFNSIFIAYLVWVLILAANSLWFIYTNDFYENFGVNQNHFLIMLVTVFLVLHTIGTVLAWYTQKGKKWAKWLFILFCLSFALDTFFYIFEITEMYKHTASYSPFKKTLSIIVWCALVVMVLVKSSNKSFKTAGQKACPARTPKSGAV